MEVTSETTQRFKADRRQFSVGLLSAVALASGAAFSPLSARAGRAVTIGLTKAVFVEDSLTYDLWTKYLESRLDRPVAFVERKTYNDIQQLLRLNEIDFAWICGYPYVLGEKERYLKYVATPVIYGSTSYKIYLIVPSGSSVETLEDLRGKIFAFSDPDSVSFRALVGGYVEGGKRLRDLGAFFNVHFFTYNHVSTVQAVADGLADGGSVDSHVWDVLARSHPELTEKTRIIAASENYGLPPIVASRHAPSALIDWVGTIFRNMENDPDGQTIQKQLQVSRFVTLDETAYDTIRKGPAKDRIDGLLADLGAEDQ